MQDMGSGGAMPRRPSLPELNSYAGERSGAHCSRTGLSFEPEIPAIAQILLHMSRGLRAEDLASLTPLLNGWRRRRGGTGCRFFRGPRAAGCAMLFQQPQCRVVYYVREMPSTHAGPPEGDERLRRRRAGEGDEAWCSQGSAASGDSAMHAGHILPPGAACCRRT